MTIRVEHIIFERKCLLCTSKCSIGVAVRTVIESLNFDRNVGYVST
jgi:hypothetical protein